MAESKIKGVVMEDWRNPRQDPRFIAHAIVRNKHTGLVCDEYGNARDTIFQRSYDIKFVEHEEHIAGEQCKYMDCFVFYFPSGNFCYYSHKDYSYEID